jgi:xylan 1,4-beta-xylosidase
MITYHKGTFYVVYTVVSRAATWPLNGYPNFVVTAENIEGPWSEPVHVNSLGFDPSLFFDEDGRCYVLFRMFDHRRGLAGSPGIGLHEYDFKRKKALGRPRLIAPPVWRNGAGIEGPHLCKHNGYYYLFTAEGGTGRNHAETIRRAKHVFGPYEYSPYNPLLTSSDDEALLLQNAGHGQVVRTQAGQWYMPHLCVRRNRAGKSPLGRETAIQLLRYTDDGWFTLSHDGSHPLVEAPAPALPPHPFPPEPARDEFDLPALRPCWQSPREPYEAAWARVVDGKLLLKGRLPLSGKHQQSVLARRITSFNALAETVVEFEPGDVRHMAGLVCYYHSRSFYYLYLSHDAERGQNVLHLAQVVEDQYDEPLERGVDVGDVTRVFMRATVQDNALQFAYALAEGAWKDIGPALNFGMLNTGYTGAMIGVSAQDFLYATRWAAFDYFLYEDL